MNCNVLCYRFTKLHYSSEIDLPYVSVVHEGRTPIC